MNFCVAILILKMEEKSNIFSLLCFIISRKIKTQMKHKKKTCAVYGEGAVTDWTGQKWFAKFRARWTMLHGQVDQLKLIAIKSRN